MSSDMNDIHQWFGLTYANYLCIPRAILQSMPEEWQLEFVKLLDEYEQRLWEAGIQLPEYRVQAVKDGKFIKDPTPHYNRGRTRIEGL